MSDTLWQRALHQITAEVKRDDKETVDLEDVHNLILEWSNLEIEEMVDRSEEYK